MKMNSRVKQLSFLLITLPALVALLVGCTATRKSRSCGVILYKSMIHDSTGKYVMPAYHKDRKLWYRDSVVIQEAVAVEIENEPGKKQRSRVYVRHYTFLDLRTRSFYEYATFTDTAKIMAKYTQPDSVNVGGGWNFYTYRDMFIEENMQSLPDTIMRGIRFKRIRSTKEETREEDGHHFWINIAYLRCDRKNSIFHIDRAFDERSDCPLTRLEWVSYGKQPWIYDEIDYVADTLSREETRIFDAWERNAKLNPVERR